MMEALLAQYAVIGGMMLSKRNRDKARILVPDDFTNPDLRDIFELTMKMHVANEPIDHVILNARLPNHAKTIVEAAGCVAAENMAGPYITLLREAGIARRAQGVIQKLAKESQDGVNLPSLLADAVKQLNDIGAAKAEKTYDTNAIADESVQWLECPPDDGIVPSGIPDLDRLINGFYPGEVTVVGARPGTGKTVLGMTIALAASAKGMFAEIVNLEMSPTQYGLRLLSRIGGIDGSKLRARKVDDIKPNIYDAAKELKKHRLRLQFEARYIEDIIAGVMSRNADVLIIDYLQLVRTRRNLDQERLIIGHISWELKQLAITKNIPIIVLSQLRRGDQDHRMPTMRDLRESSHIESDADGIILMHEPMHDKDPYIHKDDVPHWKGWRDAGKRYITMKIEKQRYGQLGLVAVLFEPKKMRYLGIAKEGM